MGGGGQEGAMIHLMCKNSISHNAARYKTNDIVISLFFLNIPLLFYYFHMKSIHPVIVVVGII